MNDRCIRFIHWNPDSNAERNFKRPKYIDRDTLYSRTRKLSILKMSIFLKFIYRFNAVPIKILAGFK